jgi:hypothetical protein
MQRRSSSKNDRTTKADKRSEAEAQIAEFLARGGKVQSGPSVVATSFACLNCGHTGTIGHVAGKRVYCPKCRTPLSL